jgi:hypothetical protein
MDLEKSGLAASSCQDGVAETAQSPGMASLVGYLKLCQGVERQCRPRGPYFGVNDFILREGKVWRPAALPAHVSKGKQNYCFMNALNLAADTGFTYVEGVAASVFPTMHAWCVDENGVVVDPTWRDPANSLYYGVAFRLDYVLETVGERGYYGIIENHEQDFPLLTGFAQNWRA